MTSACTEDAGPRTEWEFVQLVRGRPAHRRCAGAVVSLRLPPMVYRAIGAATSAECAQRADSCAARHPERTIAAELCSWHWLALAAHLCAVGDVVPANWLRLAVCQSQIWDYRELDNLLRGVSTR